MKNKNIIYKWFSVALIIISVIGFIFSTQKKENSAIFDKRGNSEDFYYEYELEGNKDYVISYWVVDEETGFHWADVSSYAEIYVNDTLAESKTINFSESEEKGGVKRAQNGFNFNINPLRNTKIVLKGVLFKGDYWEWKVYEGISETDNIKPGLFIILLLLSIFIFLKFRKKQS